jgi:rod shape-determining protein MreC
MDGMMLRTTSGTRRVAVILCALLLSLFFVLPRQSRHLLHQFGQPLAPLVELPLNALATLDRWVIDLWQGYVALHHVAEENRRLRREVERLRGRMIELMEQATASRRLSVLLQFKEQAPIQTLAAQVIGRDPSNWYQSILINRGRQDGVREDMGVIVPSGVIGRVVKTTPFSAVVLLLTDPNNAVTGVIERTRDEGIVEGAAQGRARMKYIPLLSAVQTGDVVVTSGLTGEFPRGLAIGTISRIEKEEGEVFQSAEILPQADFRTFEEVLVVLNPTPLLDAGEPGSGLDPKTGPDAKR